MYLCSGMARLFWYHTSRQKAVSTLSRPCGPFSFCISVLARRGLEVKPLGFSGSGFGLVNKKSLPYLDFSSCGDRGSFMFVAPSKVRPLIFGSAWEKRVRLALCFVVVSPGCSVNCARARAYRVRGPEVEVTIVAAGVLYGAQYFSSFLAGFIKRMRE